MKKQWVMLMRVKDKRHTFWQLHLCHSKGREYISTYSGRQWHRAIEDAKLEAAFYNCGLIRQFRGKNEIIINSKLFGEVEK